MSTYPSGESPPLPSPPAGDTAHRPAHPAGAPEAPPLGDMDAAAFRQAGHELVDWIGRYLEEAERYPVLSRVKPGAVREALPPEAPAAGEP